MKKLILILLCAIVALSSCKKDRVCKCINKNKFTGTTYNTSDTTYTTYDNVSKNTMKNNCVSTTVINPNVVVYIDPISGQKQYAEATVISTCSIK